MTDHQGTAWYHGTRATFDAFEPDHGAFRGLWFSSHRGEARSFGLTRARQPQHNPGKVDIRIYEVRVEGRVRNIDIMAEAARYADDNGIDAPATWDEAAAVLQWAACQGDYLDEAAAEGYVAVAFTGMADNAAGFETTQLGVIDASAIRIVGVTTTR